MKLKMFISVLALLSAVTLFASAAPRTGEVYFTSHPTISPDGLRIVFCYEGDLWMVKSSGGTAYRITGMEGAESYPRFSPDGKWLAFSGEQDGNRNVYVMPVEGGDIVQLTFHDLDDNVDSWSWDSRTIYFNSERYNQFSQYKVNREGGTPERLFGHYFNFIHGAVEHPVTKELYFTDSFESMSSSNRKRYKGDFNPDIKSYHLDSKNYTVHTSYNGKDFWPTIDKSGKIYFVSDRDTGEYNLFQLDKDKKIPLTSFNSSIKTPQVSANGELIVFEKDYRIFTYNTRERKSKAVDIRIFHNDTLKLEQSFNINGKISYFDVSPDGKKFAFVSRGELFVSDADGKFIRKLKTAVDGRVMEVKWLKDNKTLLFNQTVDGWQNLFTVKAFKSADNYADEKQLTFDKANNHSIMLDKKMSRAVYLSGRNHVKIMDLTSFSSRTVVTEELWAFSSAIPQFSPDGNFIVFNAMRNFETDIFIHNLKTGKTMNITKTNNSETSPTWSPDGKYLYFSVDRYDQSYPRGGGDSKIYRLPFHKYLAPFKSDEWKKLFVEKKEKSEKNKKAPSATKTDNDAKSTISFDLNEMYRRWEQISPRNGSQYSPYVIQDKDTTIVLYSSNHDGKRFNLWKTTMKPFEEPETKKIAGAASYSGIIPSAEKKYYFLSNGTIGQLVLTSNKFKPIKMNYTFSRKLKDEFQQMFFEAWAGVEENFYDEKFHGMDWRKLKDKYKRFLPFIYSRANLRVLFNDMLGELNASHTGFRSSGKEEKVRHSATSLQTGLLFHNNDPYKVKEIILESPADKKELDIRPGDRLTAVNHKKVDPKINREFYFSSPARVDELSLTFNRNDGKLNRSFTVKLHPSSSSAIKRNLYDQWIRDNQQRVDKKSNNRIAYIHMKDMGGGQLRNFLIEMNTEAHMKKALILDLRYNRGGNVHDVVLDFLSRVPYFVWKYREGRYARQPSFAPRANPMVLLINEQSLSDAEVTANGFKALKLGKVIGSETYRWIIFTSAKSLVDGSYYRLPSWGCYTLDKQNLEITGVKPDIYIKNTFIDRLEGRDPQLDAAIDEILKQLK
jgi:tricorn protease